MAKTVRNLYEDLGDQFQLRLIAGDDSLDHVVSWVHMLEDARVTEFFWGNEMVVTSGYGADSAEKLLALLQNIGGHRCAGVVLNIGPYIQAPPESVIEFCREKGLPLFTMPWNMSMTELVRSACTLITRSMLDDEDLAKAVMRAVNNPQDPGGYYSVLSENLDEERGFRMLALRIHFQESTGSAAMIIDHRSILRLHTALQHLKDRYLVFRYEKRLLVLMNSADEADAETSAASVLLRVRQRFPDVPLEVGVGDPVYSLSALSDAYHSAISAQRCANLQNLDCVWFSRMGFYRLLYSVPDRALLEGYYRNTLAPLLDYDRAHGSCLTETLFRYLLSDGSLTAVAAGMYTHRNTVNYRMGKIRELLGSELRTTAERMPLLLCYHVGVILKEITPLT